MEIFSTAWSLENTWQIREVRYEELESRERELHIYLDFERRFKFLTRAGKRTDAYDTREKQWQHLNFFRHRSYLHSHVPRLQNAEGKVYQLQVPWIGAGSGFTLLFETYAMLLIKSEKPVCYVSDPPATVKSLNEALDEVRCLACRGNGMLKNHRYTILRKYDKLSAEEKRICR
jgi:hypothetical protein